ncbi:MAG: hypothetical protein ACON4T_09325 [Synechococcus sp.]
MLSPPKGATPICSRCGAVLERQPLVRPIPLLVLLTVGSALIALSIPAILVPYPPKPRQALPAAGTAELPTPRQSGLRFIG